MPRKNSEKDDKDREQDKEEMEGGGKSVKKTIGSRKTGRSTGLSKAQARNKLKKIQELRKRRDVLSQNVIKANGIVHKRKEFLKKLQEQTRTGFDMSDLMKQLLVDYSDLIPRQSKRQEVSVKDLIQNAERDLQRAQREAEEIERRAQEAAAEAEEAARDEAELNEIMRSIELRDTDLYNATYLSKLFGNAIKDILDGKPSTAVQEVDNAIRSLEEDLKKISPESSVDDLANLLETISIREEQTHRLGNYDSSLLRVSPKVQQMLRTIQFNPHDETTKNHLRELYSNVIENLKHWKQTLGETIDKIRYNQLKKTGQAGPSSLAMETEGGKKKKAAAKKESTDKKPKEKKEPSTPKKKPSKK